MAEMWIDLAQLAGGSIADSKPGTLVFWNETSWLPAPPALGVGVVFNWPTPGDTVVSPHVFVVRSSTLKAGDVLAAGQLKRITRFAGRVRIEADLSPALASSGGAAAPGTLCVRDDGTLGLVIVLNSQTSGPNYGEVDVANWTAKDGQFGRHHLKRWRVVVGDDPASVTIIEPKL